MAVPKKTKYIIFHKRGKKIAPQDKAVIFTTMNQLIHPVKNELVTQLERISNNNSAPESRTSKLLGIYFDEHLSFDQQINILTNKKIINLSILLIGLNTFSYLNLLQHYIPFINDFFMKAPFCFFLLLTEAAG